MKNNIVVVTDSACDIPDSLLTELDIRIIPLRVTWMGKEFRDRVELDGKDIFKMMDEEIPKTSLPDAGDFFTVMDGLAAEGCEQVLFMTVSSGLSGTNNAARLWAEEYTKLKITVHDTRSLSMGQGGPVIEAARVIAKGGTIEQAIERAEKVRNTEGAYFVVKTLEFLRKGGRIGKVEGMVGSLLQIRPVIVVDDSGVFHSMSKNKGFKRAIANMLSDVRARFTGRSIHLSAIHCENEEGARALASEVKTFADVKECFITQLCPTMAIHTGRGLLGIIAYEMV